MTSLLLAAVGIALIVAGPLLVQRGIVGRQAIRSELSSQRIVFPTGDTLPPHLTRYAAVPVRTGPQAHAFAALIGEHTAAATAGRTYSQVVEEWQATGRADERLSRLRETAFTGQTLRGALLGAYQAWQITTLVIGLGVLLAAIGVAFVALAVSLP